MRGDMPLINIYTDIKVISLKRPGPRINASESEFMVLGREFDIRQGWKAWNLNNCAEWLNLKCGITMSTAREKVRVAMELFNLPLCSEAFADGTLSYSKVRALSRVANPVNEEALLDYAIDATGSAMYLSQFSLTM
ncbi:MAG TPA: DUF222 domain-containing protein [Gammaproteobacteria bacterium]|nr:DUF222 domain-containing protein [Gammaproteobacteria bacterium]